MQFLLAPIPGLKDRPRHTHRSFGLHVTDWMQAYANILSTQPRKFALPVNVSVWVCIHYFLGLDCL